MVTPWVTLVVAREEADRAHLAAALAGAGAEVLTADDAPGAIGLVLERPVDALVVAFDLAGESGLAVLEHLREGRDATPVLMVSPGVDAAAAVAAFEAGADDVLARPVAPAELVARVRRCVEVRRALLASRVEAERLRELAVTDGLTRVANHRFFQERLREEFRRAQRYDDPLALILADVDHFKQLNDAHGHQVGDEVLRALAGAMREAVRETDFLARYGGEEFAVLLPKTQLAGALTVAERITAGLRGLRLAPAGLKVTASFGVSSFPGRAVNSAEQLVKAADDALYRAKREGRNQIRLSQVPGPWAAAPAAS